MLRKGEKRGKRPGFFYHQGRGREEKGRTQREERVGRFEISTLYNSLYIGGKKGIDENFIQLEGKGKEKREKVPYLLILTAPFE